MMGERFGKLEVIRLYQTDVKMVECVCDCGNTTNVRYSNLTKNIKPTRSCGCLQMNSAIKHGFSRIPEYKTWKSMLARCYNPKNKDYYNYGNRGITVCDEWRNSFETFYRDMGEKPSFKHSLDREKNNEGYSKNNCKWSTSEEQANNRNSNLVFEYLDKNQTLTQWCRELNLDYDTVRARIVNYNWSFEEAIGVKYKEVGPKLYEYRGETKSLRDWCKDLNINYNTVKWRIQKGFLFEVAIQIDEIKRNNQLTIDNVTKSVLEWCNENSVKPVWFRHRLRSGWSFKEALTPIESRLIPFSVTYQKESEEVQTLKFWCDLLGLDNDQTYLRILRGENFEDLVRAS